MQKLPAALIACISEGRTPNPGELAEMTEKVWVEALALNYLAARRELAGVAAYYALTGAGPVVHPHAE